MDRRNFLMEIVMAGGVMCGVKSAQAQEIGRNTYIVQVARADVPNGNRRIYPRQLLEREISNFQRDHKENRSFMGQMGVPSSAVIEFSKISHVVTDMRMDGDYLTADIEVLDTPCGQILAKILKENRSIVTFRMAGIGNGTVDEKGVLTVRDNYRMISIDAIPVQEAASI